MKGWRPSACQGSKTGSGPFQTAHSRRIVSTVGLSFPGPRGDSNEDDKVRLFRAIRLAAPEVGRTTPKSVRDSKKGASPSLAR